MAVLREITIAAELALTGELLGSGKILLATLAFGVVLAAFLYSDIRSRRFRARSILAPEYAEVLDKERKGTRVRFVTAEGEEVVTRIPGRKPFSMKDDDLLVRYDPKDPSLAAFDKMLAPIPWLVVLFVFGIPFIFLAGFLASALLKVS